VNRIARYASCLALLAMVQVATAQVKVGDDLQMNANGLLSGGYQASYGDQIQSGHSFEVGASGTLSGSYYNPNFLNFSVSPYYNQSTLNSNFQSLTDSSGVIATVNLFTGSRFPGYASYHYDHDSTGTFGLVGAPNFTAIGNGQGFAVGWSALLPNWPTFSVNYSQGNGTGTLYGTTEESSSDVHTLNLRSTYQFAGWLVNGFYDHTTVNSTFPEFLGTQPGQNFVNSTGSDYGINGSHGLPWHGSVSLSYTHSTYDGNYGSSLNPAINNSSFTTNTETAIAQFHPTVKLGIFVNQAYIDNLNGFFFKNIANSGNGVPILQLGSNASSMNLSVGANYTLTKNLYAQADVTYYNQTYFGQTYNGSYVTGTIGYNRRLWDLFTFSASVIESSNQFQDNSTGFVGNVNYVHRFGLWETSGSFSYAQNVQTILVTYNTSSYNYNANVHRNLGRSTQWTASFSGSHSGFTSQPGTANHSEGFATSLALRKFSLNANYLQSSGNSVLTSNGIQPIPPTPGLLPEGLIVYDGKSYGGGVTVTPIPRLYITGNYSHAVSDTLSNELSSHNRTEIFYGQVQYHLRQISLLAGYTNFSQGISASGTAPGHQYSYFIGVSRWLNFF